MFIIFILLSVLSFSFYYWKYRDFLHPNMIFLTIWFLTCSISCIDYADFMNSWNIQMYFVTIISGISFWIGSLFVYSSKIRPLNKRKLERINVSKLYRFFLYILYIICFSCTIIEWINGGAKLSILEIDGYDVKSEIDGAIPFVHYGTIFLPYVGVMAIFNYISSIKKSRIDLFIIISIIIGSVLFHISRGELLIFVLSFIFIYSRYNKIKFSQIILITGITITMFIGIMLMRINKESLVFTMTENPYYSVFYSYIATCYANLNDLVQSNVSYHLIGDATLAPLWTITGFHDNTNIVLFKQYDMFNATTYLYAFYHDYKIFGIIIGPFLIGITLAYLYKKMYIDSSYWVLLLAMMQKAIFVPFFGNYFFGEMVILFPFLLITIIILIIITTKQRNYYVSYTKNTPNQCRSK